MERQLSLSEKPPQLPAATLNNIFSLFLLLFLKLFFYSIVEEREEKLIGFIYGKFGLFMGFYLSCQKKWDCLEIGSPFERKV